MLLALTEHITQNPNRYIDLIVDGKKVINRKQINEKTFDIIISNVENYGVVLIYTFTKEKSGIYGNKAQFSLTTKDLQEKKN